MDHIRLYFRENEENGGIIEAFYATTKERIRTGEISVKDIEDDLEVDIFYLEKHLGEITTVGIDHLRSALTRIIEEAKNVLKKTYIRIVPFTEPVPFSSLRHASVGKLFSIVGIVSRIESAKPIPTVMIFVCNKCNLEIEYHASSGMFAKPEYCIDACKSKAFTLLKTSPKNEFRDYQRIKIQELFLTEIERRKAGSINCLVERSFVNTLLPGDAVHILGTGIAEESGEDGYTVGVKANNISFLKQKDTQNQYIFMQSDIDEIKALSKNENIISILSESLFFDIVGNRGVKEGLLLSLVGGSCKKHKRKEIHMIVIGDPGMGKSKIIRKASEILPRSNYICGATTTAGGLGLAMQSNSGGEYVLAAGALVLSDLGHCFIDELDKLDNPQVLFEAMESEEITIAKAGMVCAMPARAAVIAAANPLFGRYHTDRTLQENINLPGEFLSRFDIIFIMIDQFNSEEHSSIAKHILGHDENAEYSQRISSEVAQKYIQYAREQINPVLSSSAREKVVEFFKSIRQNKMYNGRIVAQPLTPRVIDSVVRVAEAIAKIHLRSIATQADVEHAISIITMENILVEPKKKKKEAPHMVFIQGIKKTCQTEISEKEMVEIGEEQGLDRNDVHKLIYRFNAEGLLIKKGSGIYKVRM
ncbi:DNA helicase MCM8 [Nematocida minor]|uniref:DNA helicase MCM8 n=1 Tax=Nematocida minor TaxID=1912983 RepID=UPI00221E6420|nr:DNA helicase MCM8 [Nematocida minor]KAI5190256.1 DNA helicase MCM8 [Nematocida minor]